MKSIILRKVDGVLTPLFRPNAGQSFGPSASAGSVMRALLSPLAFALVLVALAVTWLVAAHGAAHLAHAGLSTAGLALYTAKDLRAERARLANEAQAILDKATTEKRELTAEEQTSFDKIHVDIEARAKQIEKIERHETVMADLKESRGRLAGSQQGDPIEPSDTDAKALVERRNKAFDSWLRRGDTGLTADERTTLAELRAQSTANTSGGYTIAPAFYNTLTEALRAFGGMRQAATVIATETGATLPMPTVNETAQAGAILAENAQASSQDITFGVVNIGAYKYTSKIVLVSLELLQDSAFDIASYIAKALADRLGRIQNTHFTVGTGSSQPTGIVAGATSGKVGTTGQTTSVIFDDLVDLVHSVDPAYRMNAKFMMHDSTLKVIKKLKDSQQRPLWLPGLALREPDTINGYPYIINQDVATMAANAKSILFGDLSKYFIRDVRDVFVMQLRERYADFGQVGFVGFARADGNLLDAGTHPVTYYANSAT